MRNGNLAESTGGRQPIGVHRRSPCATRRRIYQQDSHGGRRASHHDIWERWKNPERELVETCSIITTSANALLSDIHDRMPVSFFVIEVLPHSWGSPSFPLQVDTPAECIDY